MIEKDPMNSKIPEIKRAALILGPYILKIFTATISITMGKIVLTTTERV